MAQTAPAQTPPRLLDGGLLDGGLLDGGQNGAAVAHRGGKLPTSMNKKLLVVAVVAALVVGALFIPVGGATPPPPPRGRVAGIDLESFDPRRPETPLRLLFIHHSCGGQLFADPGPEKELANCILVSHPNGGGLRTQLQAHGYEVHEASYGSDIGENTDLFDWRPKFQTKMDKVLRIDRNDALLPPGQTNQIVIFKSCYPNSRFVGEGQGPGSAAGPELTLANAKASFAALLEEFRKRPDVLFVYVTAPPLARQVGVEPAWKWAAKRVTGRGTTAERELLQGAFARQFNDWVASNDGWLKDYPLKNVAVFDYYDALTGDGKSNHLQYPTGDGTDSHPSSAGNARVADRFVPFLNRAVRRLGLSK